MLRRLAQLLCLMALLVQVGMGALPTGEFCLWCQGECPPSPVCCCCEDSVIPDDHDNCVCPMGGEPGHGGCDRCLRVRTPERDATTVAHIGVDSGTCLPVVLPPLPLVLPPVAVVATLVPWHPPPDESPPHLVPLRTIHLTV